MVGNMADQLERYKSTESTINEIIKSLMEISKQGFGDHYLLTFDPDTEEWQSVTGFTYNHSNYVKLYTDD